MSKINNNIKIGRNKTIIRQSNYNLNKYKETQLKVSIETTTSGPILRAFNVKDVGKSMNPSSSQIKEILNDAPEMPWENGNITSPFNDTSSLDTATPPHGITENPYKKAYERCVEERMAVRGCTSSESKCGRSVRSSCFYNNQPPEYYKKLEEEKVQGVLTGLYIFAAVGALWFAGGCIRHCGEGGCNKRNHQYQSTPTSNV
ncbi:MAG: hypothetical protein C5B47_08035 [Verrucomicrobia bacterium]|nr:MAG: hypothetical protein C5B47_08035 [Verrucomicrobiota bacterium]